MDPLDRMPTREERRRGSPLATIVGSKLKKKRLEKMREGGGRKVGRQVGRKVGRATFTFTFSFTLFLYLNLHSPHEATATDLHEHLKNTHEGGTRVKHGGVGSIAGGDFSYSQRS